MKYSINWKIFRLLLSCCVLTGLMALPYALALVPGQPIKLTPQLVLGTVIQTTILFSIAIFVGLRLAKQVGFELPILEAWSRGEKQRGGIRAFLRPSMLLGVFVAMLIIFCSFLFQSLSMDFLKAELGVSIWKALLVIFYGGIAEEVLLRLFFMTFLVWISWKIKRTSEGKPTPTGIWIAIIVSSIIFGLGHLPITGAVVAITPLVVIRAILLNGIGGVIFGWLYWKRGLESAMVSHFTADVVLHVLLPLTASVLMRI